MILDHFRPGNSIYLQNPAKNIAPNGNETRFVLHDEFGVHGSYGKAFYKATPAGSKETLYMFSYDCPNVSSRLPHETMTEKEKMSFVTIKNGWG